MATRQTRTMQDLVAPLVDDGPRQVVNLAIAELHQPAEAISRAVGLPASYLQTYLAAGMPSTRPAPVRRRLAAYLSVQENALR